MSEYGHWIPVLGEPLAQVDRLLREIQAELVPGREPAPAIRFRPRPRREPSDPPAPPRGRAGPLAEMLERSGPNPPPRGRTGPLAEMLARARAESGEPAPAPAKSACEAKLDGELAALADLNAGLEDLQSSLQALLAGYQSALAQTLAAAHRAPAETPAPVNEVTLVAGPFVRLEAVRAFEHVLLALSGVEAVAVRGYEGEDRAIIDVRLVEPTP